MRLLLDELNSWRIAAQLRSRDFDVVAVKRDRAELEQRHAVLQAAAAERRAVVTNNVRDYRVAHEQALARGETHYGVIYTYDDTLPRNKAAIPLWIATLEAFLEAHPGDDALINRTHVLP